MTSRNKNSHNLIIMGIRGVPAAHGGFETFAERLALHLIEQQWNVTVYCQGSSSGRREVDKWRGVTRIHIPVRGDSALSSIVFDAKATLDVVHNPGIILTLGYNTAFMGLLLAMLGRRNAINMDGIEWRRAKYGFGAKLYLWLNEWIATRVATKLIADHPSIADHIATRVNRAKIEVIPYGAPRIEAADANLLTEFGLTPGRYLTVIARAEPENSVLEIVSGFSQMERGYSLAVLGKYDIHNSYHRQVISSASHEVKFLGPVYDQAVVAALRLYSRVYIHGHQVGGTNPSLVEALGAGNPIIAHNNRFNRWVAGDAAVYFDCSATLSDRLTELLSSEERLYQMSAMAIQRWKNDFTWHQILKSYERMLLTELAKN